ncbi:MAG: hypothetical protein GHCLOJNM_03840 [bacterium]|nr:hypothetical protein [bacterium]
MSDIAAAAPLSEDRAKRLIRYLGIIVLLLVVPPFLKYGWWETSDYIGGDFEIFHQAARKLSEGKNPYPKRVLETDPLEAIGQAWGNYIYPPLFARLLVPLTSLDPFWAKKVYLLLCLGVLFWLLFPRDGTGYKGRAQLWGGYALFFGWGPVIQTFRQGQSDFIPLFLTAVAIRLLFRPSASDTEVAGPEDRWRNRRHGLAGILIGVGAMIKLTPLLIFPVLIVTGLWTVAAGMVLGAVGALLVSGPFLSWQYFIQVLPTMADFAGMRRCPSVHIVLVRLLDSVPAPEGWEGVWHRVAELAGVSLSCALFAGVLIGFFRNRRTFSAADTLLLACFLPPLFAGEVEHHYALALLPALEGVRRLIANCAFPAPFGKPVSASSDARTARLLLVLLLLALLPNFYYWKAVKLPLQFVLPFDLATLLVLGNGVGLVLLYRGLRQQTPCRFS